MDPPPEPTSPPSIEPTTADKTVVSPTINAPENGHVVEPTMSPTQAAQSGEFFSPAEMEPIASKDNKANAETPKRTTDQEHERPIHKKLKKATIGTPPKQPSETSSEEQGEISAKGDSPIGEEADPKGLDIGAAGDDSGVISKKHEEDQATAALKKSDDPRKDAPDEASDESAAAEIASEETHKSEKDASKKLDEDKKVGGDKAIHEKRSTTPDSVAPAGLEKIKSTDQIASPKRKRSRDQFDKDLEKVAEKEVASETLEGKGSPKSSEERGRETESATAAKVTKDEPEKKKHRDNSHSPPDQARGQDSKVSIVFSTPEHFM